MELTGSAYLVAGGKEAIGEVLARLGSFGVEVDGNPDIYIREYLQFGIDEGRGRSSRAPFLAR